MTNTDTNTDRMSNVRRRVVPEPEWGWATGVETVEVAVLQRAGKNGGYTVQAVYADGTLVGHVVGRNESANSPRRWWDHVVGTQAPDPTTFSRLVFGNDSRQMALSLLTEAAQRDRQKTAKPESR